MPRRGVEAKVARAVADAINGADDGTFIVTPGAVMSYGDWDDPLQEMDAALHLDVVPAGIDTELDDRGEVVYTVSTDVAVRQRFGQDNQVASTGRLDLETLDELGLLTEQLHEFFCGDRLESQLQAAWVRTEYRASYIRKHLRELRQWTSVIRVVHDYTKPIGAE